MNQKRLYELALRGLEDEAREIREMMHSDDRVRSAEQSLKSGAVKLKRTMSPEARKRISDGMKLRYAKLRRAAARASR